MLTEKIIGMIATAASLSVIVFGLPAQIRKNYLRKSTEGLAPLMAYAALLTYSLWALYGWVSGNLFLRVAHTPGCIMSLILVIQVWTYRKQ